MSRAMVYFASVGGGHATAARALAQALVQQGGVVELHDYLHHVPPWVRSPSLWLYHTSLRRCPALWRAYYRLTDMSGGGIVRAMAGHSGSSLMSEEIDRAEPDLVVSTFSHAAALARRAKGSFLNALVITDFRPHRHWARSEADVLIVPTELARQDLVKRGVAAERVHVIGLPLMVSHGLGGPLRIAKPWLDERPVVVLCGGRTASTESLREPLSEMLSLQLPALVLCCFGSPGTTEEIGNLRIVRPGFVDDFQSILTCADLIVGKAGGLTVAEACAAGVPMLCYQPIPGHEEGNAAYLEAEGAGVWARSRAALRDHLRRFLAEPDRLRPLAERAKKLTVPDAAARIASLLLGLAKKGGTR